MRNLVEERLKEELRSSRFDGLGSYRIGRKQLRSEGGQMIFKKILSSSNLLKKNNPNLGGSLKLEKRGQSLKRRSGSQSMFYGRNGYFESEKIQGFIHRKFGRIEQSEKLPILEQGRLSRVASMGRHGLSNKSGVFKPRAKYLMESPARLSRDYNGNERELPRKRNQFRSERQRFRA